MTSPLDVERWDDLWGMGAMTARQLRDNLLARQRLTSNQSMVDTSLAGVVSIPGMKEELVASLAADVAALVSELASIVTALEDELLESEPQTDGDCYAERVQLEAVSAEVRSRRHLLGQARICAQRSAELAAADAQPRALPIGAFWPLADDKDNPANASIVANLLTAADRAASLATAAGDSVRLERAASAAAGAASPPAGSPPPARQPDSPLDGEAGQRKRKKKGKKKRR